MQSADHWAARHAVTLVVGLIVAVLLDGLPTLMRGSRQKGPNDLQPRGLLSEREAVAEALTAVSTLLDDVVVVRLMAASYVFFQLDDETFLTEFKDMCPDRLAMIDRLAQRPFLPPGLPDEVLGILNDLETKVPREVVRRRNQPPTVDRQAVVRQIDEQIAPLFDRLEAAQGRLINALQEIYV